MDKKNKMLKVHRIPEPQTVFGAKHVKSGNSPFRYFSQNNFFVGSISLHLFVNSGLKLGGLKRYHQPDQWPYYTFPKILCKP